MLRTLWVCWRPLLGLSLMMWISTGICPVSLHFLTFRSMSIPLEHSELLCICGSVCLLVSDSVNVGYLFLLVSLAKRLPILFFQRALILCVVWSYLIHFCPTFIFFPGIYWIWVWFVLFPNFWVSSLSHLFVFVLDFQCRRWELEMAPF